MSFAQCQFSPSDYVRERELFRYCKTLDGAADEAADSHGSLPANPALSPNTALTALAQLAALRLDASRAMISVVDKETQYFIAEATRTLKLSNTRKFEREGDSLWVGCTSVPKAGRLCEKTVELPPSVEKYPCFTVTDLSRDESFNELPFVTGPPHFRFYAGTPLTTENGVNIGSLFVIDDRVRPELTEDQQDCLGTIARLVMQTMKLNSEAEERRRSFKMSQGLQSFQDGRDNTDLDESSVDYDYFIRLGKESSISRERIWSNGFSKQETKDQSSTSRLQEDSNPPSAQAAPHTEPLGNTGKHSIEEREQTPQSTFIRAANILRQSLGFPNDGGVVFMNSGSGSQQGRNGAPLSDSEASDSEGEDIPKTQTRQSLGHGLVSPQRFSKPSDVISFSTAAIPLGGAKDVSKANKLFQPLPEKLLQHLLIRYPRGRMWSFDADGDLTGEDFYGTSAKASAIQRQPSRIQKRQAEARLLSQYFPCVRQLLLAPLWDSSTARWSGGCFCFCTTVRQIFSKEAELSFLMTFGNSVMAEANRLAYIAAERQKGDFIGSISHELRSPLHGILASAEFLAETEFDAFQNSLIDTISSCGRTLLDTVNHILDYSKINSYERSWLSARQKRAQKTTISMNTRSAIATPLAKETPPLMSIYATTDVAAIAEEVVEGVYAGQVYQDISSTEIAYMSSETKDKISSHGISSSRKKSQSDSKLSLLTKDIEIILDVAQGDYVLTTQPGALRRILMNLFGNSLKYTERGSIIVTLRLDDLNTSKGTSPDEKMLVLSIEDTGKGISQSYLQNHLYTAFTQEDVLATGVGLGLSIVKSIVNMLNGTIDFQSEVGKGTKVTVQVPLMKLPGTDTPKSTPSTTASTSSATTSLQSLRTEHPGKIVALYGSRNDTGPLLSNRRERVLQSYITQWYGLRTIQGLSDAADLIVVDEKDMHALWPLNKRRLPIVVLCEAACPQMPSQSQRTAITEFVSKPFGPYKLAKAIFLCFEKAEGCSEAVAEAKETFPPESPMESDTATIGPDLEQVSIKNTDSPSGGSQQLSSNVIGSLEKSQREDFPFPPQNDEPDNSIHARRFPPDLIRQDSRRPPLTQRVTEPLGKHDFPSSSAVTKTGKAATAAIPKQIIEPGIGEQRIPAQDTTQSYRPKASVLAKKNVPPRLLLVDDNKINLRLLETFVRKRNYRSVDSAENGQIAVEAAMKNTEGYDIIFMDISMPVMNGFEATRAIREIEETRGVAQNDNGSSRTSQRALIIALTGLASSRDQTEAFNNGVDLFLTKPVSFKEVGRLLDNWEARRSDNVIGEDMNK